MINEAGGLKTPRRPSFLKDSIPLPPTPSTTTSSVRRFGSSVSAGSSIDLSSPRFSRLNTPSSDVNNDRHEHLDPLSPVTFPGCPSSIEHLQQQQLKINTQISCPRISTASSIREINKKTAKNSRRNNSCFGERIGSVLTIFDWDDTFLPTTILRDCCRNASELSINSVDTSPWTTTVSCGGITTTHHLAPPASTVQCLSLDGPDIDDRLKVEFEALAAVAEKTLMIAKQQGDVRLITNGSTDWIRSSCLRYLPTLWPFLRQFKRTSAKEYAGNTSRDPAEWKKKTFCAELERYMRLVAANRVDSRVMVNGSDSESVESSSSSPFEPNQTLQYAGRCGVKITQNETAVKSSISSTSSSSSSSSSFASLSDHPVALDRNGVRNESSGDGSGRGDSMDTELRALKSGCARSSCYSVVVSVGDSFHERQALYHFQKTTKLPNICIRSVKFVPLPDCGKLIAQHYALIKHLPQILTLTPLCKSVDLRYFFLNRDGNVGTRMRELMTRDAESEEQQQGGEAPPIHGPHDHHLNVGPVADHDELELMLLHLNRKAIGLNGSGGGTTTSHAQYQHSLSPNSSLNSYTAEHMDDNMNKKTVTFSTLCSRVFKRMLGAAEQQQQMQRSTNRFGMTPDHTSSARNMQAKLALRLTDGNPFLVVFSDGLNIEDGLSPSQRSAVGSIGAMRKTTGGHPSKRQPP